MTDQPTNQQLDEIEQRATSEHLTPGPWDLAYEGCDCGGDYPCGHGPYVTGVVTPVPTSIAADRCKRTGEEPRDYDFHRGEVGDFTEADWALMVAAREDVPVLLAEVRRLRATPPMVCINCETPVGWVDCPTGGWWAHETHPADDHDADPRPARQDEPAAEDTLPAWLYQRFAVIHGAPAWDRTDDGDRAYWARQAAAVRRAVARGGFKNPALAAVPAVETGR